MYVLRVTSFMGEAGNWKDGCGGSPEEDDATYHRTMRRARASWPWPLLRNTGRVQLGQKHQTWNEIVLGPSALHCWHIILAYPGVGGGSYGATW